MIAYCFANGALQFASCLPRGALPIARRFERKGMADWKRTIAGHCRLAYDGVTYLVPGIPEAPDGLAAVDALARFSEHIEGILLRKVGPK